MNNRQILADCSFSTAEVARCYLALHKLDSARHYGLLSVDYVKSNDYDAAVTNTYLIMSEIYAAEGDWENAYSMYQKHVKVSTGLVNTETTRQIVSADLTREFELKELLKKQEQEMKDQLAEKDATRKNLILWFVSGGAVLLIFVIGFVINRLRLTRKQKNIIEKEKKRSDELLLNILPEETAAELKATGAAEAKSFDEVTVMFTDFKNFTQASEMMNAKELVSEINYIFSEFDKIISKHNIEKIKTIGDSYMCAGGLPVANKTNASDIVNAALEIQQFMNQLKEEREKENKYFFEIRIGIHSGPVVAGIVGIKKFAYDIWGDTVNIASRMESSGEVGKVNISGATYELVKEKFTCIHRGKIEAKHKGEIDMYFVEAS